MEGGRNGWNQEIAASTGEATYEKVIFFCEYIYHLNFFSGFLNFLNSFHRILGIYYFTLFGGEKVGDISAMSKSGNLNLWKFWAILVSRRVPTHLKTQLPETCWSFCFLLKKICFFFIFRGKVLCFLLIYFQNVYFFFAFLKNTKWSSKYYLHISVIKLT